MTAITAAGVAVFIDGVHAMNAHGQRGGWILVVLGLYMILRGVVRES